MKSILFLPSLKEIFQNLNCIYNSTHTKSKQVDELQHGIVCKIYHLKLNGKQAVKTITYFHFIHEHFVCVPRQRRRRQHAENVVEVIFTCRIEQT